MRQLAIILTIISCLIIPSAAICDNLETKTLYYQKADSDQWGDFSYQNPILKDKIKKIAYYQIIYSGRKILQEKHFTNKGELYYIAQYQYNDGKEYTKFEVHFKKGMIIIKKRGPLGNYQKIKYLSFTGEPNIKKNRKLIKSEEYHNNGQIWIASYFTNKKLAKQESFMPNGSKISLKYYKHINKKKVIWKEKNYNKEQSKGYWEYSYDHRGKFLVKKYYSSSRIAP